jgi:hypothetical protein
MNFLDIDYRIRYYLGDLFPFYHSPKDPHPKITYSIPSNYSPPKNVHDANTSILYTKHIITSLKNTTDSQALKNYTSEMESYLNYATISNSIYFYFKFGDIFVESNVFCFTKSRPIHSKYNILLNLNKPRHWGTDFFEAKRVDIPFHQKKNKVVWRGSSTGKKHNLLRDQLVCKFQHFDSNRIDIKYSNLVQGYENTNNQYILSSLSIKDLLQCKFILSIEGNDVATNLKWIMNSNSLVFMPKPKMVSWFMEDHLLPFVHYIEIDDDFHDLEEKYNWCMNHLSDCETIIKNANQYVQQFLNQDTEQYITTQVVKTYFDAIQFIS